MLYEVITPEFEVKSIKKPDKSLSNKEWYGSCNIDWKIYREVEMNKFIRVDMTMLKVSVEDVPEKYRGLGGRGLTSNFVNDEVKPTCHPLGRNNKLIFAPGLLSGTSVV